MKILYGSTDVTKYVLSYRKIADYSEGYILGQVSVYEIELELNNKDKIFGTLNKVFTVYEGEEQTGIFIVDEKPEKYTSVINVILCDNMIKLKDFYNSSLDFTNGVLIKDMLNEIASLSDLNIVYSNLPSHVLNKKVTWYDNTLEMINYIGWVAELSGMNVHADATGNIVFKTISKTYKYEVERVSNIEIDGSFVVSGVCFDNGERILESGTYNTDVLYLNPNNPYFDDPTLVDYIYTLYNGLSLTRITSLRMKGIRGMMLGDMIKYGDYLFVVTNLTANEYGGESYPIYELVGNISKSKASQLYRNTSPSIKYKNIEVDLGNFKVVTAKNLEAVRADIKNLNVEEINAKIANIESIKIGTAEVETLLAQKAYLNEVQVDNLIANKGYITELQTNQLIAEKGYLDEAQVNTLVVEKGYITEVQADTLITNKGYMKKSEVEELVSDKGYLNFADVNTLIAERGFLIEADVEELIVNKGFLNYAEVETLVASKGYLDEISADNLIGSKGFITELRTVELLSDKVTTRELNAVKADITNIESNYVKTDYLNAEVAVLEETISKKAMITDLDATNARIGIIESDYVTNKILESQYATIETLNADKAQLQELISAKASIKDLNSTNAEITNIKSNYVSAKQLESEKATLNQLISNKASIEDLESANAEINNLKSNSATITQLNATNAQIENIKANYVTTKTLESERAEIDELIGEKASVTELNSVKADITTLNTDVADIEKAMVGVLYADDLTAINGNIGNLQTDVASIKNTKIGIADVEQLLADDGYITKLETEELVSEEVTAINAEIDSLKAEDVTINSKLTANQASINSLTAKDVEITNKLTAVDGQIENLQTDKLNASEFTAYQGTVTKLLADKATVKQIEAINATIDELQTEDAKINKLVANKAEISALEATDAKVEALEAADVTITGRLDTAEADIENLETTKATVVQLNAANAKINNLIAKDAEIDELLAKKINASVVESTYLKSSVFETEKANINKLIGEKATIDDLEASNARISTLETTTLKSKDLSAEVAKLGYATVAELNAAKGRIDTLESDTVKADELESTVGTFGYLKASTASATYATITNLNSANANINTLTTKVSNIEKAYVNEARVDELIVAKGYLTEAEVDTLVVDKGYLTTAQVNKLIVDKGYLTEAQVNTLVSNKAYLNSADVKSLIANEGYIKEAEIEELVVGKGYLTEAEVDDLVVDKGYLNTAQVNTLITNKGYITNAQAETLVVNKGYITTAETKNLLAGYATIDLANVKDGSITTAMIGTGVVGTAQIADGSITNAKIVELTANKITTGTLSVERLEIRGSENSIVYALNNITGALQSQNVNTLNGEILTSRSITADKIVAKAITSNEIASKTITANEIAANTITASQIASGTITATQLASDSVTADKINVNSLSAISADLGSVTAGSINIGNGNFVVTSAGNLTAKNGEFSGKIDATSGKIGFLDISENGLFANLSGGTYSDYAIQKDYFKMTVFKGNTDFSGYAAKLYMDTDDSDGLGRVVIEAEGSVRIRSDDLVSVTDRNGNHFVQLDIAGTRGDYNILIGTPMYISKKLLVKENIEAEVGNITSLYGDVVASGISLKNHTHNYLPLAGGTLTGNLTGQHITGTWLQATASNHYSSAGTKFVVQDGSGWLYHRTASEVLNDIGAATAGHTHNYAGSSSVGGAATSADKINTDAGSATNPVYFVNGVPVKTTYTLGKSVPSDAKFTDTVYTHPTSSGNKHIPSGGSSGQILRWSADGTAVWGADNNTTYTLSSFGITATSTELNYVDGVTSNIQTQLNNKASATHTHDYAPKANGVYYVVGTGTTEGVWTGANSSIVNYYDGLTIAFYINVKGADTTTLNINGLGAVTVRKNASNLTTHLPVGTVVLLTYSTATGTAYWHWADYDANNYAYVRQYYTTTNANYPLIFKYDSGLTTTTNYVTKYTRVANNMYVNPSTGTITANYFKGALTGNADSATTLTGLTATIAELNYMDGVTSNVQTQLNNKASSTHTHSEYALSSHTHSYLALSGGSLTGELTFNTGTTQSATKGIKWTAINSKTPYIGYALNQNDGTFLIGSLIGTNYQDGLAIGGGSGNLLWKGARVATATDLAGYSTTSHSHNDATTSAAGFMTVAMVTKLNGIAEGANAYTHPTYTALTGVPTGNKTLTFGGTFTVSQPTSDATGHVTALTTRTYTMPSDRLFVTLTPSGTTIPASADLNTTTYLKVGRYCCSSNATVKTLKNCPLTTYGSDGNGTAGAAFMMEVSSPLSATIDNESTKTWVYRLRKITYYNTGVQYIQYCYVGGTAGDANWIYGDWYIVPRSKFTFNKTSASTCAIGNATTPVYVGSDGTITACTYTLGKSVPSDAKFTDTTYTSLKNPYSLTIQGNGTTLTNGTYDGSAAKTVNITPSSIGALSLTGGTLTGNISFNDVGSGYIGFDNGYSLRITNNSTGYLTLTTAGEQFSFTNSYGSFYIANCFRPSSSYDNKYALGASNSRWSTVYAGTGSINTSDRTKKKDFAQFDERYEQLFMDLKPQLYKFIDGTGNRYHSGFISQDIEVSLMKLGMTSLDFAGFCKDKKQVLKEVTKDGLEVFGNALDKNGNQLYDYSLRYDEFIALNTHMIQKNVRRIDSIENRFSYLNDEVAQLKSQLSEAKQEISNLSAKLDAYIKGNYEIREVA